MRKTVNHSGFTFFLVSTLLIFGTCLYDWFAQIGFTFIDEITALILFFYALFNRATSKEYMVFIALAFFYLCYSLKYGINVDSAAFVDFVIETKPYIVFYCTYNLGLFLEDRQKKIIKKLIFLIFYVITLALMIDYTHTVECLFVHESRVATFYVILGIACYYCSQRKNIDLFVSVIIISLSLLSLKAKSVSFFCALCILMYLNKSRYFYKMRLNSIIKITLMTSVVLFIVWDKFSYYFIDGSDAYDTSQMFARPALYYTSIEIFKDYFPFGSGLGTFASYASGIYYSPLYSDYGIDKVFGLSIDDFSFVSDSFFPSLAQFGVFGVYLFFLFLYRRIKECIALHSYDGDVIWLKWMYLFVIFFLIESTTDSTFVQNRGIVMCFFWALLMNEKINKKNYQTNIYGRSQ